MFSLPFKRLREIEQMSTQLPLEGLVLILTSQGEEEKGLLVYLDDFLPPASAVPWPATTLSALSEDDLLRYDGLAVGYDALDSCFPLLLTHGVSFYPIHRLFARQGRLDVYRENAHRLAQALFCRVQPSERRDEKVIKLLLPTWLQQGSPPQGLAIALPKDSFSAYLSGDETPRWLSLDDLETRRWTGDWVLTFNEVATLFPELNGARFIEWRPLLRESKADNFITYALEKLACLFWQKAKHNHDPSLRQYAYALALERWLPERRDENLVAVLTHSDFEHFMKSGDALYVSRTPVIYSGEGQHLTLDELIGPSTARVNIDRYHGPWFVLRPLLRRFRSLSQSQLISLERVWHLSGDIASLANSLLGLARDLLNAPLSREFAVSLEEISALAICGTILVGLSNPWDSAWRERYGILLDQAYQTLDDILLVSEQEYESKGIQLLRLWFGCYRETMLPLCWSEIQDAARNTSALAGEAEKKLKDFRLSATINEITKAVHILSGQQTDSAVPDHPQRVGDVLRDLTSQQHTSFVTDNFWIALGKWAENHHRLQVIEHGLAFGPPSTEQVENLLVDYRRLLRCLYGMPHELILLRHFCLQNLQHLKRLQSALRQDISLYVQLLTPQVILGEQTRLIFEVANIGGRTAEDVRFELEASPHFTIYGDAVRCIPELTSWGGQQRLDWQVLPQNNTLAVRLIGSFSSEGEVRKETLEFNVSAIRKPSKGQGPSGGNPFQAGTAVFGKRFFGRHKELRAIFDILLGDTTQPILLRGPRRMGKTSILRQIEYLLRYEGELQRQLGYSREDEARLRRWQPVSTSLQKVRTDRDIPAWYHDLFDNITKAAGITSRIAQRDDFERDPFYVFEDLLKNILRVYPSLHLLILLDEWDVERHLKEFGGQLRALMQGGETRVNWIFASTWMLSAEAGRFGSPFYAQTRPFELKEMSWVEAQTMVRTLSESVGLAWQGEALVALLDQAALRPYLIQLLGQRVFEYLRSSSPPSNLVDMETVNAVLSEFVQTSRGQGTPFSFLWEERTILDEEPQAYLSWLGRLILLIIEHEYPTPLKSIDIYRRFSTLLQNRGWQFPEPEHLTDEIRENLDQLAYIFDVLKIEGDRYTFSIPLAQAWLHNIVSQYDDPWLFAWEKILEEYRRQKRSKEKA